MIIFFEQKYVQSENDAKKAIELSPSKAMGYLILSQALYMQEKYNEAITQAQKGIKLVENDVSLLSAVKLSVVSSLNYSIANNYRELGNFQKQQEYEQKAKEARNINN